MKKIIRTITTILILSGTSSIISHPLEDGVDTIGNAFSIFYNPALICKQVGMPIAASMLYNHNNSDISYVGGFSETFSKNAFALTYFADDENNFNKISTAFATYYKKLTFGSAFNFFFGQSYPEFSVDAALNYHITDKQYFGLVVKNAYFTDSSYAIVRDVRICGGGHIPWVNRLYFTAQGIVALHDIREVELEYGGDISLQKFFFQGPSVSLYARSKVMYTLDKEVTWLAEPVVGFHHNFSTLSFGMYAGYTINHESTMNKVLVSFYINPLYKKQRDPLSCSINLSSDKFLFSDTTDEQIIITISGNFNNKRTSVKQWSVLITTKELGTRKAVRTFSGGNIPPSSIIFDGRDQEGMLLKTGTYSIQLILVDSMNRVISSSNKSVFIR